jgi:hypothetical protein
MSTIIEIFNTEEHNNLITFINNSTEIFNFIHYVFLNPDEKNINNLNQLYKIFNRYDTKAIDNIKNTDNKTILEIYKEFICDHKDHLLKLHIDNFIASRSFTNNLLHLFKQNNNMNTPKIPSILEIVNRLEYLEKTVEELKIRVSNKDFLSKGTST